MNQILPFPVPPPQAWRSLALKVMSDADLDAALAGQDAADWLAAASGSGLVEAQLRLGRLLLSQPRDPRAAYACFLCAARAGNAEAQYLLGRCQEQGWGVARNMEEARRNYRQSAESGDFRGAYHYAGLVAADGCVAGALHWFERALLLAPDIVQETMRTALAHHPDSAIRALAH